MPVKIRLSRAGRSKRPFYHVIVADSRSPRDGKYIERIGTYNPLTVPASIEVKQDRALYWLEKGAQPTDTARAILSYTGVMYKKHLQRGVSKGAHSQEQADAMFADWWEAKQQKVEDHKNRVQADKDKANTDRIAAESKIRADKLAAQQPAAVEEAAKEGVTGEPTGDAIADAINTSQEENEALLGIKKGEQATEEPTPVAEKPAEETKPEAATEPEAEKPVEEAAPAEKVAVAAVPAVEAPAKEEAAVEEAKPAAAPAKDVKPDDLKKIEGIGPKIAETLNAAGIITYTDLAGKKAEEVKAVLEAAEGNFAAHDPGTWPKQSQMAADGKWDELKAYQDELDGGKEVS